MAHWYISFANDEVGFLGATVVEAESATAALEEAGRRNLNPGGEAAILPVPEGCEEAQALLNRLASEQEMRSSHGGKKSRELSPELAEAFEDAAVRVCEDCNSSRPHTH